MQIDKEEIIKLLKSRGHDEKAIQAHTELPDKVDPEEHAGLLEKIGIEPMDLIKKLPGGLPGGLGGKLGRLG